MENSGEKLPYMDGLRGLAAFGVVIHHFAFAFFPALLVGATTGLHSKLEPLIYQTPLYLAIAGNFAVTLFFLISGYVLSYKFFVTGRNGIVISGAFRRYFRLMPTVLVSVLISYVLLATGHYYNLPAAVVTGSSDWLAVSWLGAANLWDAVRLGVYDAFITGNNTMTYNNALWTMKIEFLGSFLVYAVLLAVGKLRRRWVAYVILSLLLWQTYYLAFILGIALCDYVTHQSKHQRRVGRPLYGWLALFCGLFLGSLPIAGPTRTVVGNMTGAVLPPEQAFIFFHIIGSALVLAAVVLTPSIKQWFMLKPFQYLGRISFSLYLVHLSVLASLGSYLFLKLFPFVGYLGAVGISFTISLSVIFILAELVTRYVDIPAVRASGRLYRWVMVPLTVWQPKNLSPMFSPSSTKMLLLRLFIARLRVHLGR